MAPQAMLQAPTLDLEVVAPKGWEGLVTVGWEGSDRGVRTVTTMDRSQVLKLTLRRLAPQ